MSTKGRIKHCKFWKCNSDSRYLFREDENLTFHKIPKPCKDFYLLKKDPTLKINHSDSHCSACSLSKKWVQACNVQSFVDPAQINRDCWVCSKHFVNGAGPTEEYPFPMNERDIKLQASRPAAPKHREIDEENSETVVSPKTEDIDLSFQCESKMHEGDCGEAVVSSIMSTTQSDSLSDISHIPQNYNSSDYSQLFSSIDGQSTIATTPTTTTSTTIAQQQQQILTLLQEPLKNSLRPILPKQTSGEDESNNTRGQTTNSNSPSPNDAVSQSKLDDCNNPLAGLNMPALVTALLTLSGQPCSNPWEPLWTNQEHLLMTSNGSAMKQIVYMGNNLWKLKSDDDIK